jgi:glycosyltransferase involved in cell wall biosynthesis
MTCTNSHVVSKGNRLDDTTPLHSHSRVEASSSPKVSVIIPNYNHGRFLEKRIRSVLDQSFGDFEAIFLDDASTDDSREVFTKFAGDRRIRAIWNKQNSGGTFRQWNKGFREAKGEYVRVAESDDYADERFLEVMLSRFAQHPSVGLVCCRPMVVDDEDRIVGPFDVNSWWVRKNNRPLEDYFSKGRQRHGIMLKCLVGCCAGARRIARGMSDE